MVIKDLSDPDSKKAPEIFSVTQPPIASVADRFLALVLDFLVFSPLIGLITAGLVRQAKIFSMTDSSSQEVAMTTLLIVVLSSMAIILLQSVCLYYWQATLGQAFLQLRVVSYPHFRSRLTFNQCLIRAVMWCSGLAFFGLPFLEIVSHPLRRAFHERASDSMVVTLKKNFDEGPLPIEYQFISSWLRMSFFLVFFFVGMILIKTHSRLIGGYYRNLSEKSSLVCKEIAEPVMAEDSRLDVAVTLYLLDSISPDCLEKEAEASLWNSSSEENSLAYLAKFLIVDSLLDQEKYQAKICEDPKSSACALARYIREDGKRSDLDGADKGLLTTRLLWSEEKYAQNDYAGSLQLIKELQLHNSLKPALEKRYVRVIWSLNERQKSAGRSARLPASSNHKWLDDFKNSYEVP